MQCDDAVCNPHTTSSISQCCLMMQCATHMLCHRFLPSMLLDDAACNPHAASSISFPQCCLMMWCATHMPRRPSGKRGLVLKKPRLLWVSLETPKTSKTQRHPGSPQSKVPNVQLSQSTPKALSKHPRVFPKHLQSIHRAFPDHFQSTLSSLEYGLFFYLIAFIE